jgi:NADH-quinone oxidoreductase subunit J
MTLGRIAGGAAAAGLLVVLVLALKKVPNQVASMTGETAQSFGTLKLIGVEIYTKWLLPFEAVSLLLLVAMVGAVVVAKSRI